MARSKEHIEKRNAALVKDFDHLFTRKRKRFDDCLQEIADKYFLSLSYTERIISAQQNSNKQSNVKAMA